MIRNRPNIITGLMAAFALLGMQAQSAQAQLDMSGTWSFEVESQNGVTHPTLTLQQSGTALTGHYSSETLGESDVTGSINGNNVSIEFSAVIEGVGETPLTYTGSVSAAGVWSGELIADFQGQTFPLGTFTATKQ